ARAVRHPGHRGPAGGRARGPPDALRDARGVVVSTAAPRAGGSLLRERDFRSFFVAQTVSQLGDRVSEIAFPLIAVLVLDATPGQVAVLTAVVWLPNLASIFVGAWIDRQVQKKRILIAADL